MEGCDGTSVAADDRLTSFYILYHSLRRTHLWNFYAYLEIAKIYQSKRMKVP